MSASSSSVRLRPQVEKGDFEDCGGLVFRGRAAGLSQVRFFFRAETTVTNCSEFSSVVGLSCNSLSGGC